VGDSTQKGNQKEPKGTKRHLFSFFSEPERCHRTAWSLGSDQVAQCIRGVIATMTIIIRVGFKDISGMIGVVLEEGQTSDQPLASFVDE
jgi:hypothetical protein